MCPLWLEERVCRRPLVRVPMVPMTTRLVALVAAPGFLLTFNGALQGRVLFASQIAPPAQSPQHVLLSQTGIPSLEVLPGRARRPGGAAPVTLPGKCAPCRRPRHAHIVVHLGVVIRNLAVRYSKDTAMNADVLAGRDISMPLSASQESNAITGRGMDVRRSIHV